MSALRSKLEENLGWGILLLLLAGCLLVLLPFATALLWAAVLSFASWPLYQRLFRWLGGRRTLAASVFSLAMVLVVLVPLAMVGLTLADNVTELKTAAQRWVEAGPPGPPEWLNKIPLVGPAAADKWRAVVADKASLVAGARRLLEPVGAWLILAGFKLGSGLFQMTLSILVVFFLLRSGAAVGGHLTAGVERIGGERGRHLLGVAGNTVRGVVYGILGTALVQALMAGFGFLIAGVPGAALLALLTFFLSVVPFGPPLVWLPAALWLFHQGDNGWGIFMIIWGMGVSLVDNFVKPWLISQGSDMPFLLILFGVLGGAFAFGFIGVFIGPTLLAVGHRLLREWAENRREEAVIKTEVAPAGTTEV